MRRFLKFLVLAACLGAFKGYSADLVKTAPISNVTEKKPLMGYYPNWSHYSGYTADKIPFDYLTHILYAFYITDGAGNLSNSDALDADNFKNLIRLAHAKGVKVLVSIGGASQSEGFKSMAARKNSRTNFVDNCLKLANDMALDGIDLDWEYPDTTIHGENQLLLHRQMRAALHKLPRKVLFTAAVPGSAYWAKWSKDEAFQLLDYLNVMTYDYMGTWEKAVIPNSGMDLSTQALEYFVSRGIPKQKLVIGAAFYGKSFDGGTGMGSAYTGLGSGENGNWPWKDLLKQLETAPYTISWDEKTQSEFAIGNDEIIVFNGLPSQVVRGKFIKDTDYAGVMLWDLLSDDRDPKKSLLVALYRGLRGTSSATLVTPPAGPKWRSPSNP